MQFLIISGMSGAGKTRAADVLEDTDYYCVDNMPAALVPKLAEFCMGAGGRYDKVALVADIRDAGGEAGIFAALDQLRSLGCEYKILFMEADTPTIIRRYKESRRPHPLQAEAGSIANAVELENLRLARLRERADFRIDTSRLTLGQLQASIYGLVSGGTQAERKLQVSVMSFGFKYGVPAEADMVLDVRFLPNPYYVEELRGKTGLDAAVRDYVFSYPVTQEFMKRLDALLEFLLPQYVEEGKHGFTIAVGCTGGRHRSVAVAGAVAYRANALGHSAQLVNRDIEK